MLIILCQSQTTLPAGASTLERNFVKKNYRGRQDLKALLKFGGVRVTLCDAEAEFIRSEYECKVSGVRLDFAITTKEIRLFDHVATGHQSLWPSGVVK